ncbi:MAG: UDP-N-acetyl glucosamine 2-epimerase [Acidobacteria bacterium]|nr:UDP-N-acetyl glucosamine 2-epimerase [Acidobacteriota bacterium]
MTRKRLALVLGIRPDVIRASLLLRRLRAAEELELCFIWSGQHYSDNLKDVFFRELGVGKPDVELAASGPSDAAITAAVIAGLSPVLHRFQPEAAVFLGDTNTVMGCLAAAQLNIPIVHIEGCMRSYDWRMPEEKYRTTIDHLSDVIYTYLDEYKQQGVAEGLRAENIVVTGNPIVDVLNEFYFARPGDYAPPDNAALKPGRYYLMTCHRRENVHNSASLAAILELVAASGRTVYFPASYRTTRLLAEYRLALPPNLILAEPAGYREFLALLTNSAAVLTDSGTVVEEACILGVPSVQMRSATERPQVYDVRSSVKFDPAAPELTVLDKLEALRGRRWQQPFGDGHASQRIAEDLIRRAREGGFRGHQPEASRLNTARSWRGDGL